MGAWISKLLDRICVVLGALICIQAPLYMQQYQQQLVGRLDELSQQVEAMRQVATQSNKSLDQYIAKFVTSGDLDFSKQGQLMGALVERKELLATGLLSLREASPWARPFLFLWHFDGSIGRSTWEHYQFGIALSFEGALYALLGIGLGYAFYAMLKRLCRF